MEDFAESRKCLFAAPSQIIVATDMKDTDDLVPHAVAQAKASDAHVTLVYAIPPSDIVPLAAGAFPYVDDWKIDRDVRAMLFDVARQIESQGIPCVTVFRHGFAGEVIRGEIYKTHATRLIMGTHGRGKLGQFALGSVAHELLTKLDIPVFVVGPRARETASHPIPRKILHPVSLMGDYCESVQLALKIAQPYRAELTLLHVLDSEIGERVSPERTREWAKRELDALIPDPHIPDAPTPGAMDEAPPIHTRVTSGKLVEEILKAAIEINVDWIVLGSDGRSHSWSFKETASYKVLTTARCPVLTLPHTPCGRERRNSELAHFPAPL